MGWRQHFVLTGLVCLIWIGSLLPSLAFQATLQVVGDDDLRDGLSSVSFTITAQKDGVNSAQEILAAARADYRNLIGALYQSGHYSGSIQISVDGREAADISPLNPPSRINNVVIKVEPGQQFSFGNIGIEPIAPGTELPDSFLTGEPANADAVRKAAKAAMDGWRDEGHAKVQISGQKIVADHRNGLLNAQVSLIPGPVVVFGDFVLKGERAVREERIREIAGYPKGQVFSPEELDDVAIRLRRTGAFRSVAMSEAETLGPGNSMDITANLVDAKPRRFGFGAEISSLDGAQFSGFWMHRNLLGGAERLRIDAEISGLLLGGTEDYILEGRFDRPGTFRPDVNFIILGEIAQLDEPFYFSQQLQFSTGFKAEISDAFSAEASVGYRYSETKDDFGNRTFSHLVLPIAATFDRRDVELDPTRGYFLEFESLPFFGLGTSVSGAQLIGDFRGYYNLGRSEKFVLAGRVQVGAVVGPVLADTPPDLLFYSGGGGSVRGQPYESLGVDLGNGRATGGRSLLELSGEIRTGINDKFSVVGFYDAGFIGANSFSIDNGSWHSGAGIGVRYDTGVGPIRFDVAMPVSGSTGQGPQIYIGIGQAF